MPAKTLEEAMEDAEKTGTLNLDGVSTEYETTKLPLNLRHVFVVNINARPGSGNDWLFYITELLNTTQTLESLAFQFPNSRHISDDIWEQFINALLLQNKTVTSVDLFLGAKLDMFLELLKTNTQLTSVKIDRHSLNLYAKEIAELLKANTTITSLSLSTDIHPSGITDQSYEIIAQGLKDNKTILTLGDQADKHPAIAPLLERNRNFLRTHQPTVVSDALHAGKTSPYVFPKEIIEQISGLTDEYAAIIEQQENLVTEAKEDALTVTETDLSADLTQFITDLEPELESLNRLTTDERDEHYQAMLSKIDTKTTNMLSTLNATYNRTKPEQHIIHSKDIQAVINQLSETFQKTNTENPLTAPILNETIERLNKQCNLLVQKENDLRMQHEKSINMISAVDKIVDYIEQLPKQMNILQIRGQLDNKEIMSTLIASIHDKINYLLQDSDKHHITKEDKAKLLNAIEAFKMQTVGTPDLKTPLNTAAIIQALQTACKSILEPAATPPQSRPKI